MANYRAVANGNWSSGATWGGGAVPPNGEGHNIYSNNFTVTIDTNVDAALITNSSITASFVGGGTSAASGGTFNISSATPTTLVANITAGANIGAGASVLNYSASAPATLAVTGNLTGASNLNGAFGCNAINLSGSATLIVNGNLTAGGTGGGSANAIQVSGPGGLVVNSAVITTSGSFASNAASAAIHMGAAGGVTLNNCSLSVGSSYPAVNTTSGSLIAVNCVFSASNSGAVVVSTVAGNRLSGTFISAANGMQPISAARWFLNSIPTASYIQHALDGVNANSFVRYFTADTSLGQAAPTDVRSGVTYASGNLTGRLTIPARGTVANGVTVGPLMPFTATRSGTTATATLTYSYPYSVGDVIAVTGASNSEWNMDYTIASVISGTSVTFTVPATHSATAGTGANMQTKGTAVLDGSSVAAAVWGAASRTITGGTVDTLTNAPSVPSAAAIASQVRTELGTELGRIDAAVSSRLAGASYTAPANSDITAIKAKTDALNTTRLGNVATVESTGAALAAALTAP